MVRRTLAAFGGLVAIAVAGTAAAQSDEAKKFGAREHVKQVSLSPDGKRWSAVVAGTGRKLELVVGGTGPDMPLKVILASSGDPDRLNACDWASNTRLVCSIILIQGHGAQAIAFTRMIAVDADGTNLKVISATPSDSATELMTNGGRVIDWLGDGDTSGLLMTRQFVPVIGNARQAGSTRSGLGVERVDPVSLKRVIVEEPHRGTREYISDGHGNIRITGTRPINGAGYDTNTINYSYRAVGSRAWLPLSTINTDAQRSDATGFDPYAVDRDLNVAYGFMRPDGRRALFKMPLDGSGKPVLVFARPDVDVDQLITIGRQRRVVGVSYVTDKREASYFDPALKKLGAALSHALPTLPLVNFVDASATENELLVWVGSDVNPGRYMIFDKGTRHLDLLLPVRPELEDVKLAPVKAISFPAADGTMIPAYLTLPPGSDGKNLPAIVMPHGGPSARDEWGFDWLAQFFAARGYAVLQPNYRGSSGYGDGWFQQNGFRSWRVAIGDVNDGGRWLVKQGIAASAKLAIVGWSYGGYAALQSPALDPVLFKAIVAIAPVTDLATWLEEHRNYTNFRLVESFVGRGPWLKEGSPAQNAGTIKVPVLMFHGDQDRNVGIGESRMMASRLRSVGASVELVEFRGLDHQLEDSDARTTMLDKADNFLRATMGK